MCGYSLLTVGIGYPSWGWGGGEHSRFDYGGVQPGHHFLKKVYACFFVFVLL